MKERVEWFKVFRNVAVAHVFVVLPVIYLACGNITQKMEIEARVCGHAEVSVEHGDDDRILQCKTISTEGIVSATLPESVTWRDVRIRVVGDGDFELKRISVQLCGIVWYTFRGIRLAEMFGVSGISDSGGENINSTAGGIRLHDGSTVYIVPHHNASLWSGELGIHKPLRLFATVIALEMLLFIASFLGALFVKQGHWRLGIVDCLLVAFVASFFFGCVLPAQSYLANKSMFQFAGSELATAIFVRVVVMAVCFSVVLFACARCFGRKLCPAVFVSLVFCAYLESGLLAFGLPSLNGDMTFYDKASCRELWDSAALLVGFCGAFTVSMYVSAGIRWLCASLLVFSVASFADIRKDLGIDDSDGVLNSFYRKDEIAENVVYSLRRNVLVFVLDALTSGAAHDALEREPGLKNFFPGFVEFSKNIGMYKYTFAGTAGIVTGLYMDSPLHVQKYCYSIFSDKSVAYDATKMGMSVFFMPGSYRFGYSNKEMSCDGCGNAHSAGGVNPLRKHMPDLQAWSLDEISIFRCCPFAMKSLCHELSRRHWDVDCSSFEPPVFHVLAGRDVSNNDDAVFLYVHTEGVHSPILYNADGSRMSAPANDYNSYVGQAQFKLGELGRLFKVLMAKGVYDCSTIIILADHGADREQFRGMQNSCMRDMPVSAMPCLWVKAQDSTSPMSQCDSVTSHDAVANLLRMLFKKPLSGEEIEQALACGQREYHEDNGACVNIWRLTDAGEVECSSREYGHDVESFKPLTEDVMHSLVCENHSQPEIVVIGAPWQHAGPKFDSGRDNLEIKFKASQGNSRYDVELSLWFPDGEDPQGRSGAMTFCSSSSTWNVQLSVAESLIRLDGCISDDKGVIRITGSRTGSFRPLFFITGVRLMQSQN